jgi:hypothetical protein
MIRSTPNNPQANNLGESLTDEQISAAIRKSGYPLQTMVAQVLSEAFKIEEEWSYIDSDSGSLRAIDLLASKSMFGEGRKRLRPILDLLIECKQSELPFVFFISQGSSLQDEFPIIGGLHSDTIEVQTDKRGKNRSTFHIRPTTALGLADHDFTNASEQCATFSKCVRKGRDLELSGSEPFQSVVLPLAKAMRYFKQK